MKITLKIKDILSTNSASIRSTVDHVYEEMRKQERSQAICLDFLGINFISRSFAHEFVTRFDEAQPEYNLEITNTIEPVQAMIELIRKQNAGFLPEKNRSDLISDDFNPATAAELFA